MLPSVTRAQIGQAAVKPQLSMHAQGRCQGGPERLRILPRQVASHRRLGCAEAAGVGGVAQRIQLRRHIGLEATQHVWVHVARALAQQRGGQLQEGSAGTAAGSAGLPWVAPPVAIALTMSWEQGCSIGPLLLQLFHDRPHQTACKQATLGARPSARSRVLPSPAPSRSTSPWPQARL